jgi:hypothetical protein
MVVAFLFLGVPASSDLTCSKMVLAGAKAHGAVHFSGNQIEKPRIED